ncbi:hypothetical protein ACLB2K_061752 [Fragaria x ananassa]
MAAAATLTLFSSFWIDDSLAGTINFSAAIKACPGWSLVCSPSLSPRLPESPFTSPDDQTTESLRPGREGGDEVFTITLRKMGLSDIDDFMVWGTDKKVARFCTWEPYGSKEEGLNHIKEKILPHPWFRAICLDGRPIGVILVNPTSGNDRCRAEIGYALGSKYRGKGIVTRAVKMVVNTIFKEWTHLERLEGLVDVDNLGSHRVLEKPGFQREGVLRKHYIVKGRTIDEVVFSILSTECENWYAFR